jgi:hypothetical protein
LTVGAEVRGLARAGCKRAYIDGSFVTAKEHPRDFEETTEFISLSDSEQEVVLTTLVRETYYPLEEVVADVRQRMLLHDKMTGGELAAAYPKARVRELVEDGADEVLVVEVKADDDVSELNKGKFAYRLQRLLRRSAGQNARGLRLDAASRPIGLAAHRHRG